jgi:hypothetical protein
LVVTSGPLVNLGAIETTGVSGSAANRRIENEVIHRGAMTLGVPMEIQGYFAIPDTDIATVTSTGSALSALGGIGIDGALFDNAPLIVSGGLLNQLDAVTFQNMDPTATQLTIVNDGIDGTNFFDDLSFLTTPTTGFYVSATEIGGGNVLTIVLTSPFPTNGDAFTQELGGASVTWIP